MSNLVLKLIISVLAAALAIIILLNEAPRECTACTIPVVVEQQYSEGSAL